jgi:hypothetical protein
MLLSALEQETGQTGRFFFVKTMFRQPWVRNDYALGTEAVLW